MKVVIATILDTPIDMAWQQVCTSRLLLYVAAPLIRFRPLSPPRFPERWETGTYLVAMRLLGVAPLGQQSIVISYLEGCDEPGQRWYGARDAGHGQAAKVWDHQITLREIGPRQTAYMDEITVRAGVLTLMVYLFAQVFYRWRQWRLRWLVRNGFIYKT